MQARGHACPSRRLATKLYAALNQHRLSNAAAFAATRTRLAALEGCVWVGDRFVALSQIAFRTPADAAPYLHVVPRSLYGFRAHRHARLHALCQTRHIPKTDVFRVAEFDTNSSSTHMQKQSFSRANFSFF